MADLSDRRLLLASARADLLDGTGPREWSGVPDHVAASWRRSLLNGVHPDAVESPYFNELDDESRLVSCALPVIDRLSEQIADVPMCVALTDNRARILVRRDSSKWIGRILDRVYFAKGFGYEEGAVGTNGVGTVLEFGESVHIVGAEHFADPLQSFACAGAPIRDPYTGRIEGVLDLTCLTDYSTPMMHSLVSSAAQYIERNLLLDRNQAQQALFDVYSRVDARTREAVVAVGPSFALDSTAIQNLLVSTDREALHDHMRFMTASRTTVDDKITLPSGVQVRLRGSTVTLGEDVAGMIGVVNPLEEADSVLFGRRPLPAKAALQLPEAQRLESASPAWRAAEATGRLAVRNEEKLLVLGEAGSGRSTFLGELVRSERPGVRLEPIQVREVEDNPRELARRLAGSDPREVVHILCNLDQLAGRAADALMKYAEEFDSFPALVGATAAQPGPHIGDCEAVLALFHQSVTLPPLRYRAGDLRALVRAILLDLAPHRDIQPSPDAFRVLSSYQWPGNIRELREVLASAVTRRPVGIIRSEDLPAYCQSTSRSTLRPVDQIERDAIIDALNRTGGNRKAAANALGLARSTLYRKIRGYGITN